MVASGGICERRDALMASSSGSGIVGSIPVWMLVVLEDFLGRWYLGGIQRSGLLEALC